MDSIQNPIRRDLQLFILFTGLRATDAKTVRWEHVNLTDEPVLLGRVSIPPGCIHRPKPKGGEDRAFTAVAHDPMPGRVHPFAVAEDEHGARAHFIRDWHSWGGCQRWIRLSEADYLLALDTLGLGGSASFFGTLANGKRRLRIQLTSPREGKPHVQFDILTDRELTGDLRWRDASGGLQREDDVPVRLSRPDYRRVERFRESSEVGDRLNLTGFALLEKRHKRLRVEVVVSRPAPNQLAVDLQPF